MNRIYIEIIFIWLVVTSTAFTTVAQTRFQKVFGDSIDSRSIGQVRATPDGYVATASGSTTLTLDNVLVLKMNIEGDILWAKHFGGITQDYGSTVTLTPDNNYLVTGATSSYGQLGFNMYALKLSSSGTLQWSRSYGWNGWEFSNACTPSIDNGYYLVGAGDSIGQGLNDFYLVRIDSIGNMLWARTYGGAQEDICQAVVASEDGGAVMAGYTESFGASDKDIYLVKVDNLGDTLWTHTYGGSGEEIAYSVLNSTDGGTVVCGHTASFGAGGKDIFLMKVDSMGSFLWAKTYGNGSPWDELNATMQATNDNGFIITGRVFINNVAEHLYAIKVDINGDTLWTQYYGADSSPDYGISVDTTADGGFIFAGLTASFGPGPNSIYLVKTDGQGFSGCYEKNTNTIVGNAPFIIGFTTTGIDSGGSEVNVNSQFDSLFLVEDSLCLSTGIEHLVLQGDIPYIYPNPASSTFTIQGNFALPAVLELYDLTGRQVYRKQVTSNQQQVDVDKFANGLYIYRLVSDGKAARGKIVKK